MFSLFPRWLIILALLFLGCADKTAQLTVCQQRLTFDKLATRWDEAIPLGNGMLGGLLWQNDEKLRISLDRADLWDLRPMDNLKTPEWRYLWVIEQWKNNTYHRVQEKFDAPYDQNPAPSKIPAGALEFDIRELGPVKATSLNLVDATGVVQWENGAKLTVFVHASQPCGWYRFEGLADGLPTVLVPPPYHVNEDSGDENPVTGQDLRRLGYPAGAIASTENSLTYDQEGWGGFKYQIHVQWKQDRRKLSGCWSISSAYPEWEATPDAEKVVTRAFKEGYDLAYAAHADWWQKYWSQSSIDIPDSVLQKQWYLEQYKFGSAARKVAPPISLQAVWTADNGKLPPWKGDFHHDLNTQLSYWPAYSANHLDLEEGFIDWLWKYKPTFEKYTRQYFGTSGLNVPGVSTLTGEPMGGWIQYSFGPTVSAWLAQHFYLHWRYSQDRGFLKERAYPWIKAVAIHLDELSVKDVNSGYRKLPLSSSPEIFNNSRDAWFFNTTNFDLALIRWTYEKAAELAGELNLQSEAEKWLSILSEWPDYATDEQTGFMFAPGFPYHESHRHFSHLMAFHPLGLVDWSQGPAAQKVIRNTITTLEKYGSDWWVGYSFAWLGNLYARAFDGESAVRALRIFAECFCLPNSFHVNGDQSGTGQSKFTYRPFTLEGNFAFATGVQEMLLQSHTGIIRVFPAIPDDWQDVSFTNLRAEGAFLISAEKKDSQVMQVKIVSEKGGHLKLANPFATPQIHVFGADKFTIENGVIETEMGIGKKIEIR